MNERIAQRLAELRRAKGYSQEALARELGLSRQAVSKWERGAGFPDISLLEPLAEGDYAEPVEPADYNAIRNRLLEGVPAVHYPEQLIRLQQGMSAMSGGGLYRVVAGGAEGCAAAEYLEDGESVLFKELLLPPEQMGRGLAALEKRLPGRRCHVRTPAGWEGMKGSYLQPFAMLKWYDPGKEARWGAGTHGYMGLGFD